MTKVTLPTPSSNSGPNDWADVYSNDAALREVVNGGIDNENIKASAGIEASKLASNAKPVTWYTPKIIATEESRTNTAFGTLTTPDEITGVVVPENGLIVIGYQALMKQSASEAARAALFLGANQLKVATTGVPIVQETSLQAGTNFHNLGTDTNGLKLVGDGAGAQVTTGMVVGPGGGTLVTVFADAGTYAIGVKFKASSGSVTAKERKLWVAVYGS
jgi:hypothetical protein